MISGPAADRPRLRAGTSRVCILAVTSLALGPDQTGEFCVHGFGIVRAPAGITSFAGIFP